MFALIYYSYLTLIDSCMHIHFLNRVGWLIFWDKFWILEWLFWDGGVLAMIPVKKCVDIGSPRASRSARPSSPSNLCHSCKLNKQWANGPSQGTTTNGLLFITMHSAVRPTQRVSDTSFSCRRLLSSRPRRRWLLQLLRSCSLGRGSKALCLRDQVLMTT